MSSNDHYPQKQNNHFNFDTYQPYGGNSVSYDGHGSWIGYDTGVMDASGNTGTWKIEASTSNSCFPTNTQFPGKDKAYFFSFVRTNNSPPEPSGPIRGWYVD